MGKLSECHGQIMLMQCNAIVSCWSINKHYDNLILALAFEKLWLTVMELPLCYQQNVCHTDDTK